MPTRARSSAICLPRLYESAVLAVICAVAWVVISIYDIQRAVADKATVPIYYESGVSKLGLNQSELPRIDEEFEAITEGEELMCKEKLKTKWAALEAPVGKVNLPPPTCSPFRCRNIDGQQRLPLKIRYG